MEMLKPRWPSYAWANAFAIQEQHDLELLSIYAEAMLAAMRGMQPGHAKTVIAWTDPLV